MTRIIHGTKGRVGSSAGARPHNPEVLGSNPNKWFDILVGNVRFILVSIVLVSARL